jgi:hypothetical protein
MKRTRARILAPVLGALLGLLLVAGCSGADDAADSGDSGGSDSAGSAADAPAAAAERPADNADLASGSTASKSIAGYGAAGGANRAPVKLDPVQALIKHGTIELTSKDVGKARYDVQKIADRYSGQVTEEQTETADDGDPAYSRMVLRIPVAHFDEAMDDISKAAELKSANTTEDDVTSKLIDTKTRLAVQKRSIARITTLFDRAQSIRDIMAIEAQLSRRQAALESLERRVAYLTGQTTMSTVTVNIERSQAKKAAAEKDDDTGFVAGLKAGWSGLSTFAVGLATVLGAALPWLVVIAILGPPAWLLARPIRRRIRAGQA